MLSVRFNLKIEVSTKIGPTFLQCREDNVFK